MAYFTSDYDYVDLFVKDDGNGKFRNALENEPFEHDLVGWLRSLPPDGGWHYDIGRNFPFKEEIPSLADEMIDVDGEPAVVECLGDLHPIEDAKADALCAYAAENGIKLSREEFYKPGKELDALAQKKGYPSGKGAELRDDFAFVLDDYRALKPDFAMPRMDCRIFLNIWAHEHADKNRTDFAPSHSGQNPELDFLIKSQGHDPEAFYRALYSHSGYTGDSPFLNSLQDEILNIDRMDNFKEPIRAGSSIVFASPIGGNALRNLMLCRNAEFAAGLWPSQDSCSRSADMLDGIDMKNEIGVSSTVEISAGCPCGISAARGFPYDEEEVSPMGISLERGISLPLGFISIDHGLLEERELQKPCCITPHLKPRAEMLADAKAFREKREKDELMLLSKIKRMDERARKMVFDSLPHKIRRKDGTPSDAVSLVKSSLALYEPCLSLGQIRKAMRDAEIFYGTLSHEEKTKNQWRSTEGRPL